MAAQTGSVLEMFFPPSAEERNRANAQHVNGLLRAAAGWGPVPETASPATPAPATPPSPEPLSPHETPRMRLLDTPKIETIRAQMGELARKRATRATQAKEKRRG